MSWAFETAVVSIFQEGSGPGMNLGCGKEATVSWPDTFGSVELYVQAERLLGLLAFCPNANSKANLVSRTLWVCCPQTLLAISSPQ